MNPNKSTSRSYKEHQVMNEMAFTIHSEFRVEILDAEERSLFMDYVMVFFKLLPDLPCSYRILLAYYFVRYKGVDRLMRASGAKGSDQYKFHQYLLPQELHGFNTPRKASRRARNVLFKLTKKRLKSYQHYFRALFLSQWSIIHEMAFGLSASNAQKEYRRFLSSIREFMRSGDIDLATTCSDLYEFLPSGSQEETNAENLTDLVREGVIQIFHAESSMFIRWKPGDDRSPIYKEGHARTSSTHCTRSSNRRSQNRIILPQEREEELFTERFFSRFRTTRE